MTEEAHVAYHSATRPPSPASPAPTYHSIMHYDKNQALESATKNNKISQDIKQALEERESEKHTPFSAPLAEPFDTTYPHYAPPSQAPLQDQYITTTTTAAPPPPPPPPRRSTYRLPKIGPLIPWILFAIFFLTTLWYTSIALGIRLFAILHPSMTTTTTTPLAAAAAAPAINIYFNGQDKIEETWTVTVTSPTSTAGGGAPGNGLDTDFGTNRGTKVTPRYAMKTVFVTTSKKTSS
ncbi:hypothetical protein K504DRAFT_499261 [Pleomassaria siparia CBS 279.74]|uniref:Uncharacterized protein n=1 Tax=Pleomassaria siparia CBS 279.74 TaxID=1314801 RepID=A0A6G1KIC5_9PLEO|nr:hypothetical protein K504DRAFT_499261 [Pleomassaria siparia CBS 279.74]